MLDQEKFFNTYKVQEAFEDSGLSWDTLEKIYEDYTRRLPEMKKIADRLQDEISKVIDFHTVAGFDDIKIGNWFMKYNDFKEEMQKYEIGRASCRERV